MKSIKVMYMGKPLREIYPFAKWYQVIIWKITRFFRKLIILSLIATGIAGSYYGTFLLGSHFSPVEMVFAAQKVDESLPPVLERIAKCESTLGQVGKNGQIQLHPNKDGSVDMGKFQINDHAWGAKATELGYDLTTKEGNENMAKWLYANRGTEPWYSSKSCWNK